MVPVSFNMICKLLTKSNICSIIKTEQMFYFDNAKTLRMTFSRFGIILDESNVYRKGIFR